MTPLIFVFAVLLAFAAGFGWAFRWASRRAMREWTDVNRDWLRKRANDAATDLMRRGPSGMRQAREVILAAFRR